MMIESRYLEKWMQYIRENPENSYRFSECFWPSQIKSKSAILDLLEGVDYPRIYIFGGWYGILAQMISQRFPESEIYSIDNDVECAKVYRKISVETNIYTITDCMSKYIYRESPSIVINTSTEHVDQNIYDLWWDNVPVGTPFILQGNNFRDSPEHIRCSDSLDEFIEMSRVSHYETAQIIDVGFERYMVTGVK